MEPHFSSADSTEGKPLVRYEKQLSVTSIGTLWLGRLLAGNDAGRPLLLRRISSLALTATERQSVRREAELYAKVRHPAFIKLLGVIEQESDLVTLSEHLLGAPLMEVLRQAFDEGAPLPAPVSVRIVLDAARATAKAHLLSAEMGLAPVRRLFLPEGVFIATFGGTLLMEMGTLATLAQCATARTTPDVLSQLSPEELTAGTSERGATEVFSLGVLLWECLANRWLFTQESELSTRNEVASLPIPSLDSVERLGMPVPDQLVKLVQEATCRDPAKRHDSVACFIARLEQLPAHFIATEHQVAETLRQLAAGLLLRCSLDESSGLTSGTFSEMPPSRRSTRPPARGAFNTEPPTFAQRQLVSSFELTEPLKPFETSDASTEVVTATANEPPAPIAQDPSTSEEASASPPEVNGVETAETTHNRRKLLLGCVAVTVFALSILAVWASITNLRHASSGVETSPAIEARGL